MIISSMHPQTPDSQIKEEISQVDEAVEEEEDGEESHVEEAEEENEAEQTFEPTKKSNTRTLEDETFGQISRNNDSSSGLNENVAIENPNL